MITKTKAYSVGDKVYATLEDAQKAELEALFVEVANELDRDRTMGTPHEWTIPEICDAIVRRMDRFKDILCTTETSRPRARKANRKAKGKFEVLTDEKMKSISESVKKKSISDMTHEILDNAVLSEKRKRDAVQKMAKHGIIPAGEMIDLVNLRPEPNAA